MKNGICPSCGYAGPSKVLTKGSLLIEIALWLLLIVPGVIYSVWRLASRYKGCPKCASVMIPLDSPRGKTLFAELHDK